MPNLKASLPLQKDYGNNLITKRKTHTVVLDEDCVRLLFTLQMNFSYRCFFLSVFVNIFLGFQSVIKQHIVFMSANIFAVVSKEIRLLTSGNKEFFMFTVALYAILDLVLFGAAVVLRLLLFLQQISHLSILNLITN